jgi:iron(III) transport system ATP-binding protein
LSSVAVSGLSKSFGEVTAVDDFDLRVQAGGRTAIVGPSGSGKTTVLRLIAGFDAPDTGSISLDGELVSNGRGVVVPAHRRRIGYVAQDGALFPHLTVGQNVAFGLARGADRRTTVNELLELVSLDTELASRRPDQLSGGQQQRVALARALAPRPRLLLLDEPFSALDAELRVGTRDAAARLIREAGVTTILVTHDPDDALAFADQVVVMRDGRCVEVGTPDTVYAPGQGGAHCPCCGQLIAVPNRAVADELAS